MLQLAVCDDEAVCLRQTVDILRAALGDTPHQLKTFQNAPAVLHMLAEDGYRPDIAVLDICMGELDGISLAKEINRLAPACRVIFLSSYAGYLMDAYEAEHIYYVLKSDEAARLPVALRKALGALSSEKALTLRRGGSYQRVGLDIAHHLNTIHALLEAGNLQAASEYSEQLLPAQTYSSRLGACRNPVVDAFLYTRVQDAQARGVPVRADVSLPVELPVSNTDLIVAFGNLLDNALEACAGIPDAQITLRAHMDKGYLVIQESNPVRARQPQGKKPRRIPELERGVGFRVLGSLAAKYDGSFRHTCEDGVYTVTLLLSAGAAPVS